MEVKEEEYIHAVQALEMLEDRDEEDLSHEQKIALENLSRHTKIKDLETLEELREELSNVESLKEKHVYKILDVVPKHESTVRSLFSKERVKLDDSDIDEILDICQSIEVE